jgi:hypothetical protein
MQTWIASRGRRSVKNCPTITDTGVVSPRPGTPKPTTQNPPRPAPSTPSPCDADPAASTLQRSNASTIQRFNDSTDRAASRRKAPFPLSGLRSRFKLQRFNNSTIQSIAPRLAEKLRFRSHVPGIACVSHALFGVPPKSSRTCRAVASAKAGHVSRITHYVSFSAFQHFSVSAFQLFSKNGATTNKLERTRMRTGSALVQHHPAHNLSRSVLECGGRAKRRHRFRTAIAITRAAFAFPP